MARGSESPRGSSVVPMIQPGSQSQGRQDSSEQLGMTGAGGTNSLERLVEKKKILQEEPVIITPIDLFYRGPHNCDSPGIKCNNPSMVSERIFQ